MTADGGATQVAVLGQAPEDTVQAMGAVGRARHAES